MSDEQKTKGAEPSGGPRKVRLQDIQKRVDERMEEYGLTKEDVGKIRSAQESGGAPEVPAETLTAYERMAEDDRKRLQETVAGLSSNPWANPAEKIGKSILKNIDLPKIDPVDPKDYIPLAARRPPVVAPPMDYGSVFESMEEGRRERERVAAEDRNREQLQTEAAVRISEMIQEQNERDKERDIREMAEAEAAEAHRRSESRKTTANVWFVSLTLAATVGALILAAVTFAQSGGFAVDSPTVEQTSTSPAVE